MTRTTGDRREQRRQRAAKLFGRQAEAALDALALLDLAWHDCYGEPTPPVEVIEDVRLVSDGELAGLVSAAHLAVADFRDLRLNAEARRAEG